jgi:hypothetical protein
MKCLLSWDFQSRGGTMLLSTSRWRSGYLRDLVWHPIVFDYFWPSRTIKRYRLFISLLRI